MRLRIKTILVCGLVSALGLGTSASLHAGTLNFDPTGNGGSTGQGVAITGIDTAPGNSLAQGVNPVVIGAPFNLYFQARLSALLDANGNPFDPPGMNSKGGFDLTTVAGFGEKVSGVGMNSDGTVTATFLQAKAPSGQKYVQVYIQPHNTSNDAAGTGFNLGTLILAGTVSDIPLGASSFTANPNPPYKPLDNDGKSPNQYPGVKSVIGSGSTEVLVDVTYQNLSYLYGSQIASIDFTTENKTPFVQVEPGNLVQGQTPKVGTLNGGFVTSGGGPDVLFQTSGPGSFNLVPEPSTMALSTMAFAGLGLIGIVRRRRLARA